MTEGGVMTLWLVVLIVLWVLLIAVIVGMCIDAKSGDRRPR